MAIDLSIPKGVFAVLCLSGAIVLPGCTTAEQQQARVCPRVGVLLDAARVTEFSGIGNETREDVAYDIEISDANLTCKYDDDVIKANVEFTAEMWAGPKAPQEETNFRYFVAVTELNTSVVTKEYFSINADFSKTIRSKKRQEIEDIRINYEKLGRGDLYEILIGWDLTPGQLKYNREVSSFDRPDIRIVR